MNNVQFTIYGVRAQEEEGSGTGTTRTSTTRKATRNNERPGQMEGAVSRGKAMGWRSKLNLDGNCRTDHTKKQ